MQPSSEIGPKHIFRTLIFHHHLENSIPIELICKVIAQLYYPNDPTDGELTRKLTLLLLSHIKQFTNQQKFITEEQFCHFYEEMSKENPGSEAYTMKLCEHLFKRYKNREEKKEDVIDLEGWLKIAEGFEIDIKEATECFYHIANRKNVITFDKFLKLMKLYSKKKEIEEKENKMSKAK